MGLLVLPPSSLEHPLCKEICDCPMLQQQGCHRASYCTTRFVRFLYRMRYPHSLHLMTSPPFSTFS